MPKGTLRRFLKVSEICTTGSIELTRDKDRYARIFDLKNLEHISLDIEQHRFLFSLNLEPFTLPLLASPNIKSIEIAFRDVFDEYRFRWSPSALFTTLEGVTFPFLHTFRADGAVDAEWFQSFHTPHTDPLGGFFTRHPRIRTIGFGWMEEMNHNVIAAPQVVEDLFPSLVNLDAPAFLCVTVMASRLADQLEYIGIWDVLPPGTLHTIPLDMKRMPRLRKLVIDCSRTGLLSMDVLKQILSCAPGLEELEVTRRIDQPHQLPEAVRVVPNLRTLTFDLTRFPGVGNDAEWDAFALALAQACPKLQRVKNEDPLLYTAWDVQRGKDGEVMVSRTKAY
ncbi:hypothetical protein FRC08_007463 [Ceratobasidium sp. 394]|nr:hypothetical protein FRC08_007463 [Ceratobasidium sp. 394]